MWMNLGVEKYLATVKVPEHNSTQGIQTVVFWLGCLGFIFSEAPLDSHSSIHLPTARFPQKCGSEV